MISSFKLLLGCIIRSFALGFAAMIARVTRLIKK